MALRQRVEALKAPEPDGQAAVCKTAEAGSTPAGASQRLPRRSPLVVHPHGPYLARGRRRRSPLTPGTHTPVNQTMPDARRSDTPLGDVTDASWRTTKLSSGGLLKRKPTKNSIEAAVCCSRWFGGLAGPQRSEYRPRSRLGGPSIESSSTDGLFLFQ
jgi:hypothetical protein